MSASNDNHQIGLTQGYLLFSPVVYLYQSLYFQKMFCPFFYFMTTEFTLYQRITPVIKRL